MFFGFDLWRSSWSRSNFRWFRLATLWQNGCYRLWHWWVLDSCSADKYWRWTSIEARTCRWVGLDSWYSRWRTLLLTWSRDWVLAWLSLWNSRLHALKRWSACRQTHHSLSRFECRSLLMHVDWKHLAAGSKFHGPFKMWLKSLET
jgi:hypothetical protein